MTAQIYNFADFLLGRKQPQDLNALADQRVQPPAPSNGSWFTDDELIELERILAKDTP
jgi:hypothetical protein